MSVKSLILDLCDCDALSSSASLATAGLVAVTGALSPDWSFMSIGWLVPSLDISYVFGAVSTCELRAVLTFLDAKRLYTDHKLKQFLIVWTDRQRESLPQHIPIINTQVCLLQSCLQLLQQQKRPRSSP